MARTRLARAAPLGCLLLSLNLMTGCADDLSPPVGNSGDETPQAELPGPGGDQATFSAVGGYYHGRIDATGNDWIYIDLEARLQTLESRVSAGDKSPPVGDRIVTAIESVILRRSPAGDALTRLAGGSGVDVSYCMSRREAGQHWCEIRTPGGDTGWVPRTLIEPPPELSGERGG